MKTERAFIEGKKNQITILPSRAASANLSSQLSLVVIRWTLPPENSTLWTESSSSFSCRSKPKRDFISNHSIRQQIQFQFHFFVIINYLRDAASHLNVLEIRIRLKNKKIDICNSLGWKKRKRGNFQFIESWRRFNSEQTETRNEWGDSIEISERIKRIWNGSSGPLRSEA